VVGQPFRYGQRIATEVTVGWLTMDAAPPPTPRFYVLLQQCAATSSAASELVTLQ
jgi:hypothetical protein